MDEATLEKICRLVGGDYEKRFVHGLATVAEVGVCRIGDAELTFDERFGQLLVQTTNYVLTLPAEELTCEIPDDPNKPVVCSSNFGRIVITKEGVFATVR